MLHILLVEDNAADVLLVREAIRTSSIKADVMIAYDGEQALRLLMELKFKPDLIVLDLNVPKFDGFAILEQYRSREGAPIMVLTSSTNPEDTMRAFELGVREYIIKPLSFHGFITTVQEAIARLAGNLGSSAVAT